MALRAGTFWFILITVGLDVIALGIIIPVLPSLIKNLIGGNEREAVHFAGMLGTLAAMAQFFAAPILGGLSDRYGRRPIILISSLGLCIDYLVMAATPVIGMLLVGRFISGICSASIPTALAYIADVTESKDRAARFGMVGGAFGLGFIVGPALGGFLGDIDLRLPFIVASCLCFANFLYGWFILPESLPRERRRPFSFRQANPVGMLRLIFQQAAIFWLAALIFINHLAHQVFPHTFIFYTQHVFAWSGKQNGIAMAVVGMVSAIVSAILVKRAIDLFGQQKALIAGLSLGCIGFAAYGLARSPDIFYLAIVINGLWAISGPIIQGLASSRVDAEHQGQLQATFQSLRSVADIIGPGLFTGVFAWGISQTPKEPGAAFVLSALILMIGLILAHIDNYKSSKNGTSAPDHS